MFSIVPSEGILSDKFSVVIVTSEDCASYTSSNKHGMYSFLKSPKVRREKSFEHLLDLQLFAFVYQILPDRSTFGRCFCVHFIERYP